MLVQKGRLREAEASSTHLLCGLRKSLKLCGPAFLISKMRRMSQILSDISSSSESL